MASRCCGAKGVGKAQHQSEICLAIIYSDMYYIYNTYIYICRKFMYICIYIYTYTYTHENTSVKLCHLKDKLDDPCMFPDCDSRSCFF